MAEFGVGVVFMLFTLVAVGTSSLQQRKPFIDPSCLARDCSWSWETPTAGTQFCGQVTYSDINICPDPFVNPSRPEDRPRGAREPLNVTDVNRYFNSSGTEGATLEQHTCLVIKYELDEFATNHIKGLQVSVRGMAPPDLGHFDCIVRNFSSSGLKAYSVRNRVFTNKCFCGVKPGQSYEITVRTLPVDDIDFDKYDTQVTKLHQPVDCGTENKVDDVRCLVSEEAQWSPECIIAKQKTHSHDSGDYDIVEVTFAIAPESYNFDMYKVFVYRSQELRGRYVDYVAIQTHSMKVFNVTCPTSFEPVPAVTHRFNVSVIPWLGLNTADLFYIEIQPNPSNNQCRNPEGGAGDCKKKKSDKFRVISNPCKDDPCNPPDITNVVGTCIPIEENYTCRCGPGYMEHGGTCIVDPCQFPVEAGSAWDRHCKNGQCIYTKDRTDFACDCDPNFVYLKTPKVCEDDPCAANSETNVTICGMHGKCNMNLTNDHVSSSCICDEGYIYDETCTAKPSVGMIVGIALGSCLIGLLLFLAIICFFRNINHHEKKPSHPDIHDEPVIKNPIVPDPVSRRRVLPIFSDDHKYHKQVVHCFCRLLWKHCQCDISLWDWQKSVGPTVEMWLTTEIEAADVVLLICSKGTALKYKAKAKRDEVGTDSQGVYGDVFVKALTLLDQYFTENNASDKFVVAYFDYSRESDIPVPFKRFAKYHLMDYMESLYLRIHDKLKDSPKSSRYVSELEEPNYRELEMGKPLYKAIQDMKAHIKAEPNWYKKSNTRCLQEPKPSLNVSADPVPRLFIQQSSIVDSSLDRVNSGDSAYHSGIPPSVPQSFFGGSCSSVDSNDLEESMRKLQSMSPQPNGHAIIDMPRGNLEDSFIQPETRFFPEDMHLMTLNTELHDDPFQSGNFYSDVQIGNTRLNRQDRAGSFA